MSLARHVTAVAVQPRPQRHGQVGTLNSARLPTCWPGKTLARDTARKQELISAVLSARETASA
jgi:hypothetical protein